MSNFFLTYRLHASSLPPSLKVMRAVTLAGIAIAVAALLLALSLVRGFERVYKRSLLDFNAHIVLMMSSSHDAEEGLIPKAIKASPVEIVGASPFLYREGLIIAGGKIKGVVMKGVDPLTFRSVSSMKIDGVSAFSSPRASEVPRVILGQALEAHLGVTGATGTIQAMLPALDAAEKAAATTVPLNVVGSFESGLYDFDADFLLMPIADLQRLFSLPAGHITGWEIKLADPDRAHEAIASFKNILPPDIEAIPWDELNRDLFAALSLEKTIFALIMGILFVVALFNIVSVMVLTILFRHKEIAILKALGMSTRSIHRMMMVNGVSLAAVGVFAGVAVAALLVVILRRYPIIALDPEVYFVRFLPLDFSASLCGIIAVFCLVVSWCASSLTASRLTSLPEAEGLKHS